MEKKYYDLSTMSTIERKELFESDPKNFVYSAMHEIVDKSFDLVQIHEESLPEAFHEVLPFEVLTQLLNFMSGIYSIEDIFSHIHLMEETLKGDILLRKIQ